jgi:hypothetical protein
MNSAAPCLVCNEAGHKADHCPRLCDPLKPGFQSPPPGGGGGGGEDDEKIEVKRA